MGHWCPGECNIWIDMSQYFPDIPIRKIEDFLGTETEINLLAANGTEIPYKGWAELDFRIPDNQSDINVIKVPFLVTAESIDMPIISFNVIEQIVSNDSRDNPDFESCFSKMFVIAKPKNAEALVSLIRTATTEDKLGNIKTSKRDFVIPKIKTVEVSCRANLSLNEKQTPVIFEPHVNPDVPDGLSVTEAVLNLKGGSCQLFNLQIVNSTDHDILLPGRTQLGSMQLVHSITPVDVKIRDFDSLESDVDKPAETNETKNVTPNKVSPETTVSHQDQAVIDQIDLSDLTSDQAAVAEKMLTEEVDSFSRNDEDVLCAPGLELDIKLTDDKPVQKNYASIPRPLYGEVKGYIEDLLNCKFVKTIKVTLFVTLCMCSKARWDFEIICRL